MVGNHTALGMKKVLLGESVAFASDIKYSITSCRKIKLNENNKF